MMKTILFWIFATSAQAFHECIHDTHIVPSIRDHHAFPFRVTQAEDENHPSNHGRRLQTANESVRAAAALRRLSPGGSEFRIRVDYTYLDSGQYMCKKSDGAGGTVKNVNRKESNLPCPADDLVGPEMVQHIKKLTDAAVVWFKKALRVLHPTRGALTLKKYCYQYAPPTGMDRNTEYDSRCWSTRQAGCSFEAPDTDFELVVLANPTQGGTIAYALSCQSDDVTGRPIVGLANYGPAKLLKAMGTTSSGAPNWENIDGSLATAIHEIAHAMGFSSSKFDDFIGEDSRPLGKDNVMRTFHSSQVGKTVTRITTPKVVKYVKEQFACSDWPDAGGEIEDFGGSGTAGSHWEKRVFRDEFMTGTDSLTPVFSAISLALFEDSGWYKADYTMAEHFHWGHKAGCNFIARKCNTWDERFFCNVGRNEPKNGGCGHQQRYKGYCNLASYGGALPSQHQYIPGDPSKGGGDQHADYCPFYAQYSNGDCHDEGNDNGQAYWGETYGKTSNCFDTTIMQARYSPRPQESSPRQACFVTSCVDGLVTIQFKQSKGYSRDREIKCPVSGGKVDLQDPNLPGVVWCPPANTICVEKPYGGSVVDPKPREEPPTTPVEKRCTDRKQLTVGGSVSLDLAIDEPACLFINLETQTVGKLSLQVDGIEGMIYMRAASNDQPGGTVEDGAGAHSTDTPVPAGWPDQAASDLTRALNEGDGPISLSQGLIDNGARLLITVMAGKTFNGGKLTLNVLCAQPCQNGGTCNSGVCQCINRWGGLRCTDKSCLNDCSNHGECDTESGICNCAVGWTSGDCDTVEAVNDASSGTVAQNKWGYFKVTCPADTAEAKLTYRMTKSSETPTSDPFLFAQVGDTRPTSSRFVTRDMDGWQKSSSEMSVTVDVRSGSQGGATIGLWNMGQYAKEDLKYTGSVSCESKRDIKPCPSTSKGVCNGQGTCVLNEATYTNSCTCKEKWEGTVCDEEDLPIEVDPPSSVNRPDRPSLAGSFTIQKGSTLNYAITLNGHTGKRMDVVINGLSQGEWVGISMNSGDKKPSPDQPRNCDYHNWDDQYSQMSKGIAELILPELIEPKVTIMLRTPSSTPLSLKIELYLYNPTPTMNFLVQDDSRVPVLSFVSDEDDKDAAGEVPIEMDSPRVPLAAIGQDGRLPNPIMSMSSRSSVEGMASSKEMQLLKIEEFCSQSKTGLYVKCSNIDGTATICSDVPAVVFHGVSKNQQPKDVSDFLNRVVTQPGPPNKRWAHLSDWTDSCLNHVRVDMDHLNHYLGVAALQRGKFITFQAVMQGKDTNLFLNDQGGLKSGFTMLGAAAFACVCTAALLSSCYFGSWYRQKRAAGNTRLFAANLHRSVAVAREAKRLTELSHRPGAEAPL